MELKATFGGGYSITTLEVDWPPAKGGNLPGDYSREVLVDLRGMGQALFEFADRALRPLEAQDSYEFWAKMGKAQISQEGYGLLAERWETQTEIARLRAVVKQRNRQIRDLRRSARR